ncbi:hypothetical protein V6N13_052598 [Hibiscus sabdariffa]
MVDWLQSASFIPCRAFHHPNRTFGLCNASFSSSPSIHPSCLASKWRCHALNSSTVISNFPCWDGPRYPASSPCLMEKLYRWKGISNVLIHYQMLEWIDFSGKQNDGWQSHFLGYSFRNLLI